MRPAAMWNGVLLSYNYPSSLTEVVVVVGNNGELSADEHGHNKMGCDSCGMQSIALFQSMLNQQLVCQQYCRHRGRA